MDSCNFCEYGIYSGTELQLQDAKKWRTQMAQIPGYDMWNFSLFVNLSMITKLVAI